MSKRILILSILGLSVVSTLKSQPSINRNLTKNDALHTTYAADMDRTNYRWDQAYHFEFYKENKGISFVSRQGGNLGLAFVKDGEIISTLGQMYSEPVISSSYNDQVWYSFYPYQDIKVESKFLVYSSSIAIHEITIINESMSTVNMQALPYFEINQPITKLKNAGNSNLTFEIRKERDNWMKQHDIPFVEELINLFKMEDIRGNSFTYQGVEELIKNYPDKTNAEDKNLVGFKLNLALESGQSKTFRAIRGIAPRDRKVSLLSEVDQLKNLDLEDVLNNRAQDYKDIPQVTLENKDYENLYWSAFSLIRQCMMPPEGESSLNYYVFSREPKWGWGYGGQVFHESLVMLAYAFMDAQSAMNSQRVFMERQWPSGYINYRTGPYLNEQIEHDGQFTSSAPWFNYQNYQVYKITGDEQFLKEAYESGVQFYNYYIENRDVNNNGLCEWGAHAVLESVRDARVAVWDKVDWPSNFESPDLNAMLVMEAKSLAAMADALGLNVESKNWKDKAETRKALINKHLWESKTGFYYNVDKNDLDFDYKNPDDLKIMEIIGFIPLWAGVPDKEQAEKLIENMTDPDKFWRRFGIPTLSAEDDYYNPIGYWNGPIWVQWQYLIFRGLIDYGYEDLAIQLA
ncbi:MAG: trehalase family glycosidase, partial [Bacteroidota bacterium]